MSQKLLEKAAYEEGFDSVNDMLEHCTFDSISVGICKKCKNTTETEPDQDAGYCEECESHTVVSVLILAGLI